MAEVPLPPNPQEKVNVTPEGVAAATAPVVVGSGVVVVTVIVVVVVIIVVVVVSVDVGAVTAAHDAVRGCDQNSSQ